MIGANVTQGTTSDFFARYPMDMLLGAVVETLPAAILSGEGRARMVALAAGLPGCGLESTFGFESRLDERQPLCDLFLSAQPDSRFCKYLIDSADLPDATPAQRGMSSFLVELANPSSVLAKWFGTIILEYDVASWRASSIPDPGVFIEPRGPATQEAHLMGTLGQTPLACGAQVLASSICLASGWQRESAEMEAIATMIDALPEGGELLHIGAMTSRRPRAIRLVCRMLSSKVADCLSQLGWRGSLERLAALSDTAARLQDSRWVTIACDIVAGKIAHRIGFEIHLKHGWAQAHAKQWDPIFKRLVSSGWCRQDKAEALLAWPKRDTLVANSEILALLTGVNHVKLVLEDGRIYSKAYLGAFLVPQ